MLFLREGRLFRSVSFDFVFRQYFRAGCDLLTVIAFILDRFASRSRDLCMYCVTGDVIQLYLIT